MVIFDKFLQNKEDTLCKQKIFLLQGGKSEKEELC